MNSITFARFAGERTLAVAGYLWQWDYGQVLKIEGLELPTEYEVHFSNTSETGTTTTVLGDKNGVNIPDALLETGNPIFAFIYLHDLATDGETEYKIKIPVRKRPHPDRPEPSPEQTDLITQAITALNQAVERTDASAEEAGEAAELAQQAAGSAAGYAQQAAESAQEARDAADGMDAIAQTAVQARDEAVTASQTATAAKTAAQEAAASVEEHVSDAEEYARQAAQSASDAGQSASAASQSAQSAEGSATSAGTSAQTATAKAQEASDSASGALASAEASYASATQAGTKATEAAWSASAASGSASSAAQSASDASGEADRAETAASSVSAAAAQIATNTADITDLKADLKDINESLVTFFDISTASAESGYPKITDGKISANASYSYVTFPVMAGEPVVYVTKTTESTAGIAFYDLDGVFISGVAAKNTPQTIIVPTGSATAKAGYRTAEADFFHVSIASNNTTIAQVNNSLATYDRKKNDGKTSKIYTGYANISTGNMSTNASYAHYKIAVYPGEKVVYKTGTNESNVGIVFFNDRKKYISGIAATKEKQTIIVPQGASMAVVAYRVGQESSFVFITNVTAQRVFDISILSPVYLPKFVLPQKAIAVVGHEWNLFYDNVIRGMDFGRYAVNVRSVTRSVSNKKCFEKCFRILPQIGDIGSHTVTVQIIDKVYGIAVDEAIFELVVIADTAQTRKKVMFIGDSLTNAGVYAAEIQYNLSNGGIVSVGTRQTTVTLNDVSLTVNHEGRSGWASYDYTRSVQSYKTDVSNPFWDGEKFNFAYYMENANVDTPDIVCIGLGTNGGSAGIADIQTMVYSIHDYNSDIPVLISLITPPAGQDGCGYHVGMQNADLLKTDFLDVVEHYITSYEGGDNTDIVALYFQLDRDNDFNTVNIPVSARNPKTITIQANNVHPSEYGYLHFADAYYNRILYHLI